jgi:hypothetical protein
VEPWIPAEAYQQYKEIATYYEENIMELKNQISKRHPEKAESN